MRPARKRYIEILEEIAAIVCTHRERMELADTKVMPISIYRTLFKDTTTTEAIKYKRLCLYVNTLKKYIKPHIPSSLDYLFSDSTALTTRYNKKLETVLESLIELEEAQKKDQIYDVTPETHSHSTATSKSSQPMHGIFISDDNTEDDGRSPEVEETVPEVGNNEDVLEPQNPTRKRKATSDVEEEESPEYPTNSLSHKRLRTSPTQPTSDTTSSSSDSESVDPDWYPSSDRVIDTGIDSDSESSILSEDDPDWSDNIAEVINVHKKAHRHISPPASPIATTHYEQAPYTTMVSSVPPAYSPETVKFVSGLLREDTPATTQPPALPLAISPYVQLYVPPVYTPAPCHHKDQFRPKPLTLHHSTTPNVQCNGFTMNILITPIITEESEQQQESG